MCEREHVCRLRSTYLHQRFLDLDCQPFVEGHPGVSGGGQVREEAERIGRPLVGPGQHAGHLEAGLSLRILQAIVGT